MKRASSTITADQAVRNALFLLPFGTVAIFLDMIGHGIGYRMHDPLAVLLFVGAREAAEPLFLVYPWALLSFLLWAGHVALRQLPRIVSAPNALLDAGRGVAAAVAILAAVCVYLGVQTAYAGWLWLYDACTQTSIISATCDLRPTFSSYIAPSIEQFIRGMAADFNELWGPSTTAPHAPSFTFVAVKFGFNAVALSAWIVLPLLAWHSLTLYLGRRPEGPAR